MATSRPSNEPGDVQSQLCASQSKSRDRSPRNGASNNSGAKPNQQYGRSRSANVAHGSNSPATLPGGPDQTTWTRAHQTVVALGGMVDDSVTGGKVGRQPELLAEVLDPVTPSSRILVSLHRRSNRAALAAMLERNLQRRGR